MESLTPAQNSIAENKHRFRVINCGRRFGKTTLAIEEIKGFALSREARICYIAPTIQQARDIAFSAMQKELKPIIVKAVSSPSIDIVVKNLVGSTSLIQLRGWEAIETLRGQYFDFLVIDEVASMRNFWLNWQEVIRPTLTDRKGQVMFISTPKGFNHFFDLFNLENKDKDYKSFKFTSYDNPFIPKEELDKAREELTEDRFAQEYMADFRKTQGLVYKEFNREHHVTSTFPEEFTETVLGIDFGYTNPASIVPIRLDKDNHYWIREEWYRTGKTTEEIAEQAKLYNSTKVYPDPAEPDRIAILTKLGLNCRETSKDVVAGIDHVREMFKQGRIHIHPDCVNLIMELETYRYPDKRPDNNEPEKPIKENDHLLDALRYVLYNIKPITKDVVDPYFENMGTYYKD